MELNADQINYIKKREKSLETEYSTFKGHHRELAEVILPRLGRWTASDTNKGGKKNGKIYDNTGKLSLNVMVAGMMSGLTSPARLWFNLLHPDPEKQEIQSVLKWNDVVRKRMNAVFNRSNLYDSLPRVYEELGLFGQGPIGVFEDNEDVIYTQTYTAGEYYIANNDKGIVNTFARNFRLTVGQVVAKFGLDAVSESVKNAYNDGNYENWVDIHHLVEVNNGRDFNKADSINKKFRNVYIEQSSSTKALSLTGYDEFPILCPRWNVTSNDVYASSCPAMDALGDINQLQIQEKRSTEAVEKIVRPSMVADSSLRNSHKSLVPGGITYSDFTNGDPKFRPTHQVNLSINEVEAKNEQIRDRIRKAFFADLFLMMTNIERKQITAREVAERHEEKLLMLGPVLERLNRELYDPLIDRAFSIMYRRGLIPEAPLEIQGERLKTEYVSTLHQAQRSVGVGAIERFIGFGVQAMQADPRVKHKINFSQAVDEYGSMLGVSPGITRSDEEADKLIKEEYDSQAKTQNLMTGMNAAKVAKDLSDVKDVKGSALEAVINQAGG